MHLMRNKGWETMIDECVDRVGPEGGRVVGQLWVGVCRKCWTNFSATCVFAWQTQWSTGYDLKGLREYSVAMGKAHVQL